VDRRQVVAAIVLLLVLVGYVALMPPGRSSRQAWWSASSPPVDARPGRASSRPRTSDDRPSEPRSPGSEEPRSDEPGSEEPRSEEPRSEEPRSAWRSADAGVPRAGPLDPVAIAAAMYCVRDLVREEGGDTFHRREEDGVLVYEARCRDGHVVSLREDKNGDGVPERFTHEREGDVVRELFDESGDGVIDATTTYRFDAEGRLASSRTVRAGGEEIHRETRAYSGGEVTISRRSGEGLQYLQVQHWEGGRLVGAE